MISPQDRDKILEAVRIEDVIEQFVPLKRRGANYVACCPFHEEKTPSFSVNPARNIFKCFGCGKAGNAVTFLMEHNHYSYTEALKWLAQRYGIQIEEKELTPEEIKAKDEKDELYNINEFAQKYFYNNLLQTEEGKAIGLSYFTEREVSKQTIDTWGLGYCMQKSDDFSLHALKNGYTEEVLLKSGLSLKSEKTGKLYDRFHSRVTFPIYNVAGRVLGFSARILTNDKTKAKYVNSPETIIYTKGNVLFGLYFAKSEIAKQDECYLVEGNVDAVMMHQNNVKNVVASSGTALTEQQVKLIKRYTNNVVILYDGDSAGIHATIRATDMFLKEGIHVKTVLFPDNDDPDSFARKHTQDEFHKFLKDNAQNFITYRANLISEQTKNDPIQKASLVKEIVHSISLIPDLIERNVYIQQCSSLLDMSEQILTKELSQQMRKNSFEKNKKEQQSEEIPQPSQDIPITNTHTATVEQKIEEPITEEEQERALIKVLISYSDKDTTQLVVNDDNVMEYAKMNATEYILSEILADDIKFNNNTYQKIFDLYVSSYTQDGKILSYKDLINNQDEEIVSMVCNMLISPYKVSDRWLDKYNVSVPMPEDQISIDRDIRETLLLLKYHKISSRIISMEKQLKDKTGEEAMQLLYSITINKKIKVRIAQELGIIIK